MDPHRIELPREIIIATGAIDDIAEIFKKMNMRKTGLLLTGPNTIKIAGQRVMDNLISNDYKIDKDIVTTIDKGALDELVKEAKGYKFLVGVGGGRIIDVARYTSFKLNIPFISIPTAPSHDGISSTRSTLSLNGKRYSFEARAPAGLIIDMDIIKKAPYRLIASGCADMIAKTTAVTDWKLSHIATGEPFSEYAASLSLLSADTVLKAASSIKKLEEEGLRKLVEGLISSGIAMCIAGSSRPASGSEHLFSHTIDTIYPERKSLHGEQCGVGCIIASYLNDLPWKEVKETLKNLGCPTNAQELGVPEEIIVKALVQAKTLRKNRYTILNKVNIDEGKAREAAKVTGVI